MKGKLELPRWRSLGFGAFALALLVLVGGRNEALTLELMAGDDEEVTFTGDVASILQENCQACHQPGSIGPMSLLTYDEVRPWGPIVVDRVVHREMPPYQYDTDVGIQDLKYDPRLSDEEIATIVAWADQGYPLGDPALMPPPVVWPDPAQYRMFDRFGAPDVVVTSDPYDVPAAGQDRWWRSRKPTGLTEDRCIRAIETKPSVEGRASTHHVDTTMSAPGGGGGGFFSEYAIGKLGEIVPEGACRVLPADATIGFDIHYYPNGHASAADQVDVGVWLYPADYDGSYRQTLTLYGLSGGVGGRGFDIPPHGTLMTQGFHQFNTPVRIDSFQPHGHTRLVAMSLQILRANGRTEMVSMISNWSALWHHSHIYGDDVAPLLANDDMLILTGWYDNTTNNRYNPDPDQWVSIGDRTADEMSHAWLAVTRLDQEGYDRILAERRARLASDN